MPKRFYNRTQKISLSQVDLKLFFNFYQTYISSYIFEYKLSDGTELVIKFDDENFSHLLGLHKFKKIKKYKNSSDINQDILNNLIVFNDLKKFEPLVLNAELKDRLTFFPVLRTLLDNPTYVLKYNPNVSLISKINFTFLITSDKISILVFLAVKKIDQSKKICYPVTFLVDRVNKFAQAKMEQVDIIYSNIISSS